MSVLYVYIYNVTTLAEETALNTVFNSLVVALLNLVCGQKLAFIRDRWSHGSAVSSVSGVWLRDQAANNFGAF